jgi:bifunctional non-homologous end joining protein LigD
VIGFADEAGARPPRVRALYVGRRERGRIVYAGKIQTRLTIGEVTKLRAMLATLSKPAGSGTRRKVIWLLPRIEAEVTYSNVTAGGMLRHGILKGLRYDLKA